MKAIEKHWTPAELADYWGIELRTLWKLVDEGDVPFLYRGRGTPAKGRPGKRGLYRFVPELIREWDQRQLKSFAEPAAEAKAQPATSAVAKVHDGKIRGGRKGTRKAAKA